MIISFGSFGAGEGKAICMVFGADVFGTPPASSPYTNWTIDPVHGVRWTYGGADGMVRWLGPLTTAAQRVTWSQVEGSNDGN